MMTKSHNAGLLILLVIWSLGIEALCIVYRCPICYTLPMIGTMADRWLDLNPSVCRQCGAPLTKVSNDD